MQESLTNVLRHSGARHALVRVAQSEDHLTLEVLDDGDARAGAYNARGQGLRGMAERACALGGRCEAGFAPGGGWRVQARLPLPSRP